MHAVRRKLHKLDSAFPLQEKKYAEAKAEYDEGLKRNPKDHWDPRIS